ncbi:RNA-binding protein [Clostridium baratii]|uniref:YlmH family RNA-binding protein n=1 Tax=Clostridium baratii TaxID=1561 RepID=UPI0006BAAD92|nr:YlmH/Sll1252 family protein [Clostridium baratii]
MYKEVIEKKFKDEEKITALNLYKKMMLAYEKDIPMFGNDFYPPNIWKFFEDEVKLKGLKVETFGVFNDSERRMISFNNLYNIEFPIKVLKIDASSKFNEVTHRNYLGSLLSLGIERDKIGDLIVDNNICYVAVCSDISDYIIMNLERISKNPCKIKEITTGIEEINHQFKNEFILIQSMRLDSVVAKLTKKSRGIAQEIIEEGLVLVNYTVTRSKSFEISKGDRVTIRRYGKFIIGECSGQSKSGKYKIEIKKYT